jgi:sugar/nucleoside kinase (ribokinase family)
MRSGIIAGGNWIVDRVKVIDAWPPQDALTTIVSDTAGNGGSPYNVLKNLSRLGATFPLEGVGLVGDDPAGRSILEDCSVHGMDTTQLRSMPGLATSYTDVMTERGSGRRTFFHYRGANACLEPRHFDFSKSRARLFHLGYLLLLDGLDACDAGGLPRANEVLQRARAAGLQTSLDCVSEDSDRFASVVTRVLPEVDVLFVNDFEAEKLTGVPLGRGALLDRPSVEAAARALIKQGVRQWVILHFPEGVCACSAAGSVCWQPAVRMDASEIGGTAGAGDALASGVLWGLHENWGMPAALNLGACVAAASLRHPTCSNSVGTVADCLQLGVGKGFCR